MNSKFIVFTRGRTGSSAIIDELNNVPSIIAAQELFIQRDFSKKKKIFEQTYPFVPPYYKWKIHGTLLQRLNIWFISEKKKISRYLDKAEKKAAKERVAVFGFKVLSHHFDQTPSLLSNLLQRHYRVIYLTRNLPRQVISGIIAKQRGKYNTKDKFQDDTRYEIDLEEFDNLLRWGEQSVKNDLAMLKNFGFEFVVVSYEDFLNRREEFFKNLLNFFKVPVEIPLPSSYSIMIKDLNHTVSNYQEVIDYLEKVGMDIQ